MHVCTEDYTLHSLKITPSPDHKGPLPALRPPFYNQPARTRQRTEEVTRVGWGALEGAALTSSPAKSCGGGPLSGPGSRFLRRHTTGIGPGQLDGTGQTIDTGRQLERPPHPHPHHVTSCQRGARKPGGRGDSRTFGARDLHPCAMGGSGRFDGRDVVAGEGGVWMAT